MIAIQSAPSEVRFTVSVTRAESGRTETYDMVGHIALPMPSEPHQEHHDVPLALDCGT